jgi:nucleoside-diphosphate-sugar epimerase
LRVFITGGAGFIGSNIAEDLIKKGHYVTVYDNFSSGTRDNLIGFCCDRLSILEGDIRDENKLSDAMKGHDIVSHHAAQLEIFLAHSNPSIDLDINTIGTLNVLAAAKNNNISKLINVSSACVYGQVNGMVDENAPQFPNWDYGVSKLAAERYSKIYNDYKNLNTINLRYAIVYGEKEWFRRVLPIYVKRIAHGQAPVVFGAGEQIRDFIHVSDVVSLHYACMMSNLADGQTLNVGTGRPTKIVELARLLTKIGGINSGPIHENIEEGKESSIIKGKKRNMSELKVMLLDVQRAKKLLHWEPMVDLEMGLKRTLDWYMVNQNRWQKIFTTDSVNEKKTNL